MQTASWLISDLFKSSDYSIHDENRTIFLLDFKLSLYVSRIQLKTDGFASTRTSYASAAKLSSWFEFATRPNSGA